MKQSGFTLIELMIVVAIIGILSSYALPAYQDYVIRAQIVESHSITNAIKGGIQEFYQERGRFPADNAEAGLPASNLLIGNYVTGVEVVDGAMHVTFGHYVNLNVKDKVLSIQPMVVTGSPTSPISWSCGTRAPPPGMEGAGSNRTTLEPRFLPTACR
ncbi:MAG: pilin [Gammaproteobacteria bacterium]